MGGSGGGLVPPGDRSGRRVRTAARGRRAATGLGRAARRAARSARFLAHHKGHRDRHHRHQRVRDRRHRWAGARGAAAVLRPRPDAAARQHASRRRRPGRRTAVVPVVGRQHSHRPQRAHRARGAEGRRRGHLRGPGHARGAAHCRRRRPVVTADRRGPSAVAHRNRFAFRRTRRAHPGAVAAQRADRAPRRARPEVRPRRPAGRAAAQRAGDRAAGRRLSEPVAGLADRHAGRGAPGAAERAHRTAPGVRPRPGTAAGPARRRDRRGAAHR